MPDVGISEEAKELLRELFMTDGTTPTAAAGLAGVSPDTAKQYFEQWADELLEQCNSTPDQSSRHERARVRSGEWNTRSIMETKAELDTFEQLLRELSRAEEKDSDLTDRPSIEQLLRERTEQETDDSGSVTYKWQSRLTAAKQLSGKVRAHRTLLKKLMAERTALKPRRPSSRGSKPRRASTRRRICEPVDRKAPADDAQGRRRSAQ